jgi:hypothetical protein
MKKRKTPEIRNAALGEFIKARRESLNLTKVEASRRSGLDYR